MPEANKQFVHELFQQHHHELYGYLLRRLRGKTVEAMDVAQETYLRLLRMNDTSVIRQPHAYLYKVASHVVRELGLAEQKHAELPSRLIAQMPESSAFDQPETGLNTQESVRHLEQLMNQMPSTYKAVLLLRKQQGLSHHEIADRLEISIHTVKKYLFRALAWCRDNAGQVTGDES